MGIPGSIAPARPPSEVRSALTLSVTGDLTLRYRQKKQDLAPSLFSHPPLSEEQHSQPIPVPVSYATYLLWPFITLPQLSTPLRPSKSVRERGKRYALRGLQ